MKPKRTVVQAISWWWNRSVKLQAAIQDRSAQSEFGFDHLADELSPPSEQTVTAILTVYRRGQYLSAVQIYQCRTIHSLPTALLYPTAIGNSGAALH